MCLKAGQATYYYHTDGLGSITELTDPSSSVIEKYSYDIFGNVIIKDAQGNVLSQSAVGNPYFFTARALDPETGLYYYRARYYNPKIGRFLQTDPVGYSAGINLYAYCSNNPINYTDPMGLRSVGEQIGQSLIGAGEMIGGVALTIGSLGSEAASLGASSAASVPGVYIGVGATSIGFTNLLEGLTNSGTQVMPDASTMPGLVVGTTTQSETAGNLTDLTMPSAQTPNDLINATKDVVDAVGISQAIKKDIKNSKCK